MLKEIHTNIHCFHIKQKNSEVLVSKCGDEKAQKNPTTAYSKTFGFQKYFSLFLNSQVSLI